MDYQKIYSKLFNGITETIEKLKELQLEAEELYLTMADGEGDKVIKLNVIKGKNNVSEELYVLSVDDTEYEKLLQNLYTDEWKKPVSGLLNEDMMNYVDATAVEYAGTKFSDVVLHIANKSNSGKHIISLSPVSGKGELSEEEHIAILQCFENAHKDIKFNRRLNYYED